MRVSPPFPPPLESFYAVTDQSEIHKVARLLGFFAAKFLPPGGGSRERRQGRGERGGGALKSEKLNYIAVKNDARGFSVS